MESEYTLLLWQIFMSMLSCEGMEVLTYLGSFYTMSLDRKKPV